MACDPQEDLAEQRKSPLPAWPKLENQLRTMFMDPGRDKSISRRSMPDSRARRIRSPKFGFPGNAADAKRRYEVGVRGYRVFGSWVPLRGRWRRPGNPIGSPDNLASSISGKPTMTEKRLQGSRKRHNRMIFPVPNERNLPFVAMPFRPIAVDREGRSQQPESIRNPPPPSIAHGKCAEQSPPLERQMVNPRNYSG